MPEDDKKDKKVEIPKFSYSLQTTHFRKSHKGDISNPVKHFGHKVLNDEEPHIDYIGKNSSICRELYGLGLTIKNKLGIDLGLGSLDNHIWIPQTNLSCPDCPENGKIHVCLNCVSILINNMFIPYTELKKK